MGHIVSLETEYSKDHIIGEINAYNCIPIRFTCISNSDMGVIFDSYGIAISFTSTVDKMTQVISSIMIIIFKRSLDFIIHAKSSLLSLNQNVI